MSSIQTVGAISAPIDIGFTFIYNGKDYTQLKASTGGYVTFNTSSTDWSFSTLSSNILTIAPLGYGALSGSAGKASYKTEGISPNRIFTMEWLNWKWDWNAVQAGISFQVKLYETSNRIEFIYRQEAGTLNQPYGKIGLSFHQIGKYICLTNSGSSPSVSTIYEYSISSKPATGQIYRFDESTMPEPDNHVTGFALVAPGSVSVKWTDAIGTNLPSRYLIKASNVSFADITDPVDGIEIPQDLALKDGTGAAYVDYGKNKFAGWTDSAGSATIYMKIYPINNAYRYANYKTDGAIPQIQVNTPFYESRNLSFSNFTTSSLNLKWIRGSGNNCVVFAKEKGTGIASPVNNTTYSADAVYGSGTQIGSTGWFCVYNGSLDSVKVTGLKAYTSYAFHVLEYSGNSGAEQYSTANVSSAHGIQQTNLLTEVTGTGFAGVCNSSVAWGDYDNDGDLDILLTGSVNNSSGISKIYKNNGNNTFTEQTGIPLTGVYGGSVAWGDYDNDGDLDILITGYTNYPTRISKIYRNNGNNTFTEQTGISLAAVGSSSVAWGDYDNDGDLDILLTGASLTGNVSKIYRNNGNNTFTEQTGILLTWVYNGSVAWGDYDNDGFLDILLTGNTGNGRVSKIYRNNGDNTFTEQAGIQLTGVDYSSVAWGDYDNDGFLDILLTGSPGSGFAAKIYRNNGNNTFTEQTGISLTGIEDGSVAWGDYDNDGDLDILMTGWSSGASIYRNNGDNTFTEQKNIPLPRISAASLAWGDFDNDGDLDVLLTGCGTNANNAILYRNEILNSDTIPEAPSGLSSTVDSVAALRWNPVKTDATPAKGLTYNVRIGTTSGAGNVVSPMANAANGFRNVAGFGNAQLDTSFSLRNIKKGTYYWSVQAVDNSFAGGTFAPEQTFSYNADYPASGLSFTYKNDSTVKCSWTRGNGDKCAVFVKERGIGKALPVNNTTYVGSKTFGSGAQIDTSGWYCVYNGVLDSVTVTHLKATTREYRFQVIEYTGSAGSEVYYTSIGPRNPAQYKPAFSEQLQISLPGVSGSTQAWGDYNNDGKLDLLIAGYDGSSSVVKLYKNNGDNTFTYQSSVTFSVGTVYDAAWGDYDNDGDLDILIASTSSSKLYENNGDGTFTLKANLPEVFMGKCVWADLNNDGFKDIILTGSSGTKVLKNNHDGTFTAQANSMPAVSNYSAVACGDYDNDGDLDILLAGLNGSTEITKVFRNDGDFTFTEQTGIILPGIANCAVAWADMDNDGDLDIVISGGAFDLFTKIYDNNGNNTFTEIAGTPFMGLYRSALCVGDFDNDGYRDLIVSGSVNGSDYYTLAYHNNGNKTYSQSTAISLPGIQFGSLALGDYDNDGDLDLFLCGNSASGKVANIFSNNCLMTSNRPTSASIWGLGLNGNEMTFYFNKTTDDKTASNGLTYNIYLYNTSKNIYGRTPEAFPSDHALNGRRLVARLGDIQYSSTGYTLKGLQPGNYTYNIQAIDAGMQGSAFSTGGSFKILDLSVVGVDIMASRLTNTTYEMQYSFNSTDGTNGTWSYCYSGYTSCNYATGGFDVWVRERFNVNNKLKIASIATQKTAPAYTINYLTETTTENIPETVEYSTSNYMGAATSGIGTPVKVTPGTSLYLREKATATVLASAIQVLTVPARPSVPSFTIDYGNETTAQSVSSVYEFASNQDMSDAVTCAGSNVGVLPGKDLYFRVKATASSFCSNIQTLAPPARPATPAYTIDYANEYTTQNISSLQEYATRPDMNNATTGVGAKVVTVPGQNLYFRTKATASSFCSNIQALISPSRPATPTFTIDYINETTVQSASSVYEYASSSAMYNAFTGAGNKVKVIPGQNLYFRFKATDYQYKSEIYTLEVSSRPAAPTNLLINDVSNTFDWTYNPNYSLVGMYEYSVDNGNTWRDCTSRPIDVGNVNIATGALQIRVKAGNSWFKGEKLVSAAPFTIILAVLGMKEAGISMYPNPATDFLYLDQLPEKSKIIIYSQEGRLIKQANCDERRVKIPIDNLASGMYILKIETVDQEFQAKFLKQ